MRTFSNQVGGYTLLSDIVTQELGLTGSAVYGVVWRHCQMKERLCKKSAQGIGQILGLNERTVRKWLKRLVEQGYLRKTQSSPNHYVTTDKVEKRLELRAKLAADSPERDSEPTAKAGTRVRPERTLNPANPESESAKETHEETHEETIVGAAAPPPQKPHQEMFATLICACRWDINFLSKKRRAQLNRASKQLRDQAIRPAPVPAAVAFVWLRTCDIMGPDL